MFTNHSHHLRRSAGYAFVASITTVSLLFVGFFLAEPKIGHGQADTTEFTITQQIVDETSFLVEPADVNMSGSIN